MHIEDNKEVEINFKQTIDLADRREEDRRKDPGDGFTYISTVGWICRREKTRRKNDPFDFC